MQSDITMRAIEYTLDALDMRSKVIADNVANSEVPGFRAGRVSFQQTLKDALSSGSFEGAPAARVEPSSAPAGAQGNNVELESEFVGMMETNLLRDVMIESYNSKVELLRLALKGQ